MRSKVREMKIFIIAFIFLITLPMVCLPAANIYDNFSFGDGGYIGNSTDADIQLPLYYALRVNFSASSLSGNRILGYSLGVAKDLTGDFSLDVSYAGDKVTSYISDSVEALFSYRPFMRISTFLEFQVEGGYSFILHSNEYRNKNIPCHAIKIGLGGGFMQTTSLAFSYSFFNYLPSLPDGYSLQDIQGIVASNSRLAGVLGVISGFPGSIIDLSISHYLTDILNVYFSYSYIRQALGNSLSHSYLLGGDYYILTNWSMGLAYNLFRDPTPSLSSYYSINTRISF